MPTHEPLATLLSRLDPDPDRAGQRYEKLRRKLLKFFAWRGHADADILADETFDRVSKRLDEGLVITNVDGFCLSVARKVESECRRGPEGRRVSLDEMDGRPDPGATPQALLEQTEADRELDREHRRMARRLRRLPADARALLIEYYRGSGRERIDRRLQLAAERDLNPNALRIVVCRLRRALSDRVGARRQAQHG